MPGQKKIEEFSMLLLLYAATIKKASHQKSRLMSDFKVTMAIYNSEVALFESR